MGKKKTPEKKSVKQDLSQVSNGVAGSVYIFTDIVGYDGMTVSEIIVRAQRVQDECGPDAIIKVTVDDYFGSSADLVWSRLETDEEFAKRLERSEKAKVATRAGAVTKRKQKRVDELAELERLKKKYPTK